MSQTTCDVMIIGGGVAGALTALAAARSAPRQKKGRPALCLVQTGPGDDTHTTTTAAGYSFVNPRAATLLPAIRSRLSQLTDGAFKGMLVVGAEDGRRSEYKSRATCGYFVDGPKLLKGLLAMCRAAGVKLVRPAWPARFATSDGGVRGVWADGQCEAKLALLADPDVLSAGQADGLGLRPPPAGVGAVRCYGVSFAASPKWLNATFGRSRQLITVWQMRSLRPADGASPHAPGGQDSHAWLMPKNNAVAIGVMVGASQAGGSPGAVVIDRVLDELRQLGVLPADLGERVGAVQSWQLPLATALEAETHTGKRSLAVSVAGGFVAALSGQWLYPTIHAAMLAGAIAEKALADARPQDVLSQFGVRWRQKLSDYLRSPNTRLAFLLPLVLGNQQIANRFCRAYLFGENF